MTNHERLLEIADHLEIHMREVEDTGLYDQQTCLKDILSLRKIAGEICPDWCDGG